MHDRLHHVLFRSIRMGLSLSLGLQVLRRFDPVRRIRFYDQEGSNHSGLGDRQSWDSMASKATHLLYNLFRSIVGKRNLARVQTRSGRLVVFRFGLQLLTEIIFPGGFSVDFREVSR